MSPQQQGEDAPTADMGMAVKIKVLSFNELKVKYSKPKMSNKATGTAMLRDGPLPLSGSRILVP